MAWHWTGDKSLPEPMVTRICHYMVMMVSPGLSNLKYYSEFHSLPDIDFPYTGLYPAQGPRGKRPELESQLTSKAASSKRPRFLGFLPPARAQTSLTQVPSPSGHFPRTWKPVSLHNQHHTLPQRIWNKTRGPKYSLRIISKFGNLYYYINLPENDSRECGSCRDGRSPRVESTATIT